MVISVDKFISLVDRRKRSRFGDNEYPGPPAHYLWPSSQDITPEEKEARAILQEVQKAANDDPLDRGHDE